MSVSSFRARCVLPALLLLGLAAVPAPPKAEACAIVTSGQESVRIDEETALIVYDSATRTEHFLRTAKFNTFADDFGFFVPTPSQPFIAEASGDIFPKLTELTAAAIVHRTIYTEGHIECMPQSNQTFSQVGSAIKPSVSTSSSVQVVEHKRIGALEAVVLKADDAAALQRWLTENKYTTRPALGDWFGDYIRLGWYITAFKMNPGGGRGPENPAVRISFKTDAPFYPYREPLDQRDQKHARTLRLFVLSDDRVEGKIGTNSEAAAFAGLTYWSKPVPSAVMLPLLEVGKLPVHDRDWRLTEFEDRSSPRPGTDDLFFSTSKWQDQVERPPQIIYVHKTSYWGVGMIYGSVALCLLLALYVVRRTARRAK